MTAHAAFLQAITESPDDDAPRLIYADWLEEHGDGARAEFIRLQVRLATSDDPVLHSRQAQLLKEHRERWLAELPGLDGVIWDEFRRGFVEAVHVSTAEAFSTHAPVLFRAAPVREVNFCSVIQGAVRKLTRNPSLAHLRSLLMQHQQLRDVGALASAGSQFLTNLLEVYLPGNHIGDEGAIALAESNYLTRLTHLDLRDNLLTEAGVAALARSPNSSRLRTLYLVNNQVADAGLIAMAESPYLSNLKHLFANHNRIGDVGVTALSLSRTLRDLESLDLRNNVIGGEGGVALASSPYLGRIRELRLTGNTIDTAAAEALRRRFGDKVKV